LEQMAACVEDRQRFEFNLSAFLSAARSVLQYGLLEAERRPGGKVWYDVYVAARPILAFFKDKRDISIHKQPVRPAAHVAVTVTETVVVSESVVVEVRDPEGNLVERLGDVSGPADMPPAARPSSVAAPDRAGIEYSYRFADWPGGEDLLVLSRRYLAELRAFVADGRAGGYLSP
jgi:hypothetical protein